MLDNLSVVAFTHTNVADVWPMFFGQVEKFMPYLKINVFCNTDNALPFSKEYNFIKYNDLDDYYLKYCGCLKEVKTDYVLTLFEDQIIYDYVDKYEIIKLLNFLNSSEHSFLRLLKTDIHQTIPVDGQKNIFIVPEKQHYLFSMQPSLWKRKDLIEILEHSKISSIFDEMKVSDSLRVLHKTGTYVYRGEEQIGRNHCSSLTFPHHEVIARGKWLTNSYGNMLFKLFDEYKIDFSKRGCA